MGIKNGQYESEFYSTCISFDLDSICSFSVLKKNTKAKIFEVALQPSEISLDVNMMLYTCMNRFLYIAYVLVVSCGCLNLLLYINHLKVIRGVSLKSSLVDLISVTVCELFVVVVVCL